MRSAVLFSFLLLFLPVAGVAQEPATQPLAADVETIEGIVTAFYQVVSGPQDTPRQWDRDGTLYLPGVTFTPSDVQNGVPSARTMTKEAWVAEADSFLVASGFVERELHRVTEQFGNVARVASSYEWQTADGQTGRGVNFIHLFHDGDRWWITHATWDSERPDNPIPAAYLPE